jgi:hypothetical protein
VFTPKAEGSPAKKSGKLAQTVKLNNILSNNQETNGFGHLAGEAVKHLRTENLVNMKNQLSGW